MSVVGYGSAVNEAAGSGEGLIITSGGAEGSVVVAGSGTVASLDGSAVAATSAVDGAGVRVGCVGEVG